MNLIRLRNIFIVSAITFCTAAVVSLSSRPTDTSAISEAQRRMFAENNILFYDPGNNNCLKSSSAVAYSGAEVTWPDLKALGSGSDASNARLRLMVETYGPLAMDLQREYGVPWEFVFAVMIQESQVGIEDADSVATQVEKQGFFNLIGSTLGNGTNHYAVSQASNQNTNNHSWSMYDSVSNMILGFTIYHIRNGNIKEPYGYDLGLKALDPNNYDLHAFLEKSLMVYAPPEDKNDTASYINNVKNWMTTGANGWTAIADVRKEKGWPTSEELAKQENIQPGGHATTEFGWGDIREKVYEAYGPSGLPNSSSSFSFTSYQTSDTTGKTLSAETGSVILHTPKNPWLDNAGIENFTINKALNSAITDGRHIDTSAMELGTDKYTPFAPDAGNGSGLPGFIILHWTAADNFNGSFTTFCGGDRDFYCPPHFTIDLVQKKTWQHFPLSSPSTAVSVGSSGISWDKYGIQIEIVGHGGSPYCMSGACSSAYNIYNFTDDEWQYLAKLLIAISNETGIPLASTLKWDENISNRTILSASEMKSYIGIMGHIHVEGSQNAYNKNDPGKAWPLIEKALGNSNYTYNSSSYSAGCQNFNRIGSCKSMSADDGGCTTDNFTYYWQGGPSWSNIITEGDCQVGGSGCGFVSTAMMLTALTGKIVTISDAVSAGKASGDKLTDNTGPNTSCNGQWSLPGSIIKGGNYNISYTYHGGLPTIEAINSILDRGGMAITTVGGGKVNYKKSQNDTWNNGYLTTGGHFIVIRGKFDNSTWQIFTSSSSPDNNANNYYYDASSIVNAMKGWYGEAYAK